MSNRSCFFGLWKIFASWLGRNPPKILYLENNSSQEQFLQSISYDADISDKNEEFDSDYSYCSMTRYRVLGGCISSDDADQELPLSNNSVVSGQTVYSCYAERLIDALEDAGLLEIESEQDTVGCYNAANVIAQAFMQ
jgi:hypothetical protein